MSKPSLNLSLAFSFSTLMLASELVVSTLVEKLIFEEDTHITWEMSTIVRPTVTGKRSNNSELPLRVSLAPSLA